MGMNRTDDDAKGLLRVSINKVLYSAPVIRVGVHFRGLATDPINVFKGIHLSRADVLFSGQPHPVP